MTPDLVRLAERVKKRRVELELGIEPAARSAGMSKDTWKRVEAGLAVRDTSYAKIDSCLLWATGSCASILAGGEPVEIERSEVSGAEFAKVPAGDIEEKLRTSIQGSMVTGTDLSVESIRLATELAIKAMKEYGLLPDAGE